MKLILGTNAKSQLVNINAQLKIGKVLGSGVVVEGVQRCSCMDI